MFDKDSRIISIQLVLILLIVLVAENSLELYWQYKVNTSIGQINRAHVIKHDHAGAINNPCDVMVKRYERRALALVYASFTTENLEGTVLRDLKNIPVEDVVYVKLNDDYVLPAAYFDEKGFLQTAIKPPGYENKK